MPDKIRCPYCERSFDVDQIETSELFQERIEIAHKFGPLWHPANEYIDTFRAGPGARITLKRRVRFLKELLRLVETKEFELDGKRYRVDPAQIKEALTATCDAQKTGLKNHNYLKRVMVDKGAARVSAEGLTARQERKIEDERLAISRASRAAIESEDNEILSREEIVNRAKNMRLE